MDEAQLPREESLNASSAKAPDFPRGSRALLVLRESGAKLIAIDEGGASRTLASSSPVLTNPGDVASVVTTAESMLGHVGGLPRSLWVVLGGGLVRQSFHDLPPAGKHLSRLARRTAGIDLDEDALLLTNRIGASESGAREGVICFAPQPKLVPRLLAMESQLGLNIQGIIPELALTTSLTPHREAREQGLELFIDLASTNLIVAVCRKGRLLFTRTCSVPDGPTLARRVSSEVERTSVWVHRTFRPELVTKLTLVADDPGSVSELLSEIRANFDESLRVGGEARPSRDGFQDAEDYRLALAFSARRPKALNALRFLRPKSHVGIGLGLGTVALFLAGAVGLAAGVPMRAALQREVSQSRMALSSKVALVTEAEAKLRSWTATQEAIRKGLADVEGRLLDAKEEEPDLGRLLIAIDTSLVPSISLKSLTVLRGEVFPAPDGEISAPSASFTLELTLESPSDFFHAGESIRRFATNLAAELGIPRTRIDCGTVMSDRPWNAETKQETGAKSKSLHAVRLELKASEIPLGGERER